MISPIQTLSSAYQAALTAAAFFRIPDAGLLRISGADRVDFLNRQTTNDVRRLALGLALTTVLTSPTARIEDVLALFEDGEDILALTLPGLAAQTARYFRGKIFFMDKVAVANASGDFVQFDLSGPAAVALLENLSLSPAPDPGAVSSTIFAGSTLHLLGEHAYRLIVSAAAADALTAALIEAGASELSAESAEVLRVEAGLPAVGRELTGDYTPLEAGMGDAISESKGCYTGQEIIARQITYDKVVKRLAGLRLEREPAAGDSVLVEGKRVGEITSAVTSPRFGPIALAYLKRPLDKPGTNAILEDGTPTTVVALPFN